MKNLIAHSTALSVDTFLGALSHGSLSGFVCVALRDDRVFRLVIRNGSLLAAWGHGLGPESTWTERRVYCVSEMLRSPECVYSWEVADAKDVRDLGVAPLPMMAALLEAARLADEAELEVAA